MADNLKYLCPVCAGELRFDSDKQKMVCKYCDNEFDVEQLSAQDQSLDKREEPKEPEWLQSEIEGMKIYLCSHCGGQVVGEETLGATTCPYCDTPMVIADNFSGDRKPEYIIPFKIKKDEATKRLEDFCKNKKFLPNSFLANNRVESLKGMYVPFWLYDCDANATFLYEGTKVRSSISGDYNITETSYYELERAGNMTFSNVPVDGSEKMDDKFMQSIEPFNYNEMVPFKSAYLAGYLADRYDVNDEDAYPVADMRIKTSVTDAFKNTAGREYSTAVVKNKDINTVYEKAKYALLPVWILSTNYKGTIFTYIMNGQTGKFVGRLPVDGKKKSISFWLCTSIFSLIGLILALISMKM